MLQTIKLLIQSWIAAYHAYQERVQKEIYTNYYNIGFNYAWDCLNYGIKTPEELYTETEQPLRASWDTPRYAGIRAAVYDWEERAVS